MSVATDPKSYEGEGGWNDGRIGQAYDLIDAAFRERERIADAMPVLRAIETLDQGINEEQIEALLDQARALGWKP